MSTRCGESVPATVVEEEKAAVATPPRGYVLQAASMALSESRDCEERNTRKRLRETEARVQRMPSNTAASKGILRASAVSPITGHRCHPCLCTRKPKRPD